MENKKTLEIVLSYNTKLEELEVTFNANNTNTLEEIGLIEMFKEYLNNEYTIL